MKIRLKDILDFLEKNNIPFEITGKPYDTYRIASMFQPVEKGFYFFVAQEIPAGIKDSLILTNNNIEPGDNNVLLKIEKDPQMVYYSILSSLFEEKSTGVIQPTARIHPQAVIGDNVQIDDYCIIGKVQIEDNSIIKSHCVIEDNTYIGKNTLIENHSHIGARGMAWVWNEEGDKKIILPQLGGVHIENNCILGSNSIVVRGSLNEDTFIGAHSILAPGCRLGHGTRIGRYVHFANNVITGGNAGIGDYSFVGSSAVFRPKVKLHDNTVVGSGAVVVKNTTRPGMTLIGVPAKEMPTKENPAGMPKPKNQ